MVGDRSIFISEAMAKRYYHLNQQLKEIEKEMSDIKQIFHDYFDEVIGKQMKGETLIGEYLLQRQIRESVKYDEERTVEKLEKLNLNDCVKIVKVPDEQKIEAALTLGLITNLDLMECKNRKISQAILVRKV